MDYNNISDRIKGRKKEVNADPFFEHGVFTQRVVFGESALLSRERNGGGKNSVCTKGQKGDLHFTGMLQVMLLLFIAQQGRWNHLSPRYIPFKNRRVQVDLTHTFDTEIPTGLKVSEGKSGRPSAEVRQGGRHPSATAFPPRSSAIGTVGNPLRRLLLRRSAPSTRST